MRTKLTTIMPLLLLLSGCTVHYAKVREPAEAKGVDFETISGICKGEAWKYGADKGLIVREKIRDACFRRYGYERQ